ncbi:hypothetical protein FHX47_001392 [Garicola koreensis]|uniref:Uncharacterized protein n=1 Tax=Garicola koreensis TaxID=1262554 RepID=A0A7W5U251_9MICC|nr:hypothetical protein [Garicola koreensis]
MPPQVSQPGPGPTQRVVHVGGWSACAPPLLRARPLGRATLWPHCAVRCDVRQTEHMPSTRVRTFLTGSSAPSARVPVVLRSAGTPALRSLRSLRAPPPAPHSGHNNEAPARLDGCPAGLFRSARLRHDDPVDTAHLEADETFGPCLVRDCPNYIGRHPAYREATDPRLESLHAAHQHQGRYASLRDGLRPPLTLVRDAEEG